MQEINAELAEEETRKQRMNELESDLERWDSNASRRRLRPRTPAR